MSDRPKLSADEVDTIQRHNAYLIESAEAAVKRLKEHPDWKRIPYIINQVTYWQNAASALKWSSGQAKQRMERPRNVKR